MPFILCYPIIKSNENELNDEIWWSFTKVITRSDDKRNEEKKMQLKVTVQPIFW